MHGPTRRAGSVGGVRNIKNVCLVAKAVMEHTGHVMLVGEGAEHFAVANLKTDVVEGDAVSPVVLPKTRAIDGESLNALMAAFGART